MHETQHGAAQLTAAAMALSVAEGTPEDVLPAIKANDYLLESICFALAILAGRGVKAGEGMEELLTVIEDGIAPLTGGGRVS
jgi:hypothetical protein